MTLIDWRLSDHIHWLQHMMADSNDMSLLHEQQGAMINTEGTARNLNGDVDDEDGSVAAVIEEIPVMFYTEDDLIAAVWMCSPNNPDKVSISETVRQTGIERSTIRRYILF